MAINRKIYRQYYAEIDKGKIKSIRSELPDKYFLKIQPEDSSLHQINFYLLDKKRGIALIENLSQKPENRYKLMVSADKIREFPMIINECDSKSFEFDFEKPDYRKLLQRFRK